jgi:hypothetical protein
LVCSRSNTAPAILRFPFTMVSKSIFSFALCRNSFLAAACQASSRRSPEASL